ncbi:MAG: cytochrome P450 [Xenococcaceae cyanobacterium MO_188.B29]|nr:cytochrome P450 [Xenococcaceae cyanobacterium MO_188.B29]
MVLQQSAPVQLNKINKINKIAPPGPPNFPLVGMLPFLGKHLHRELHKLAKKYGNVYQLNVGGRNLIVLNGLEVIKEALVKKQHSFNSRADFDIYQQQPQCTMLELKSGEFWEKHHEIVIQVMHTFFAGKSDLHESWVLEEATDLANIFINSGSQAFDPNFYLPLATLSFMQRLMFSQRGSLDDSEENTDFVATAHILSKIPPGTLDVTKLVIIPPIWRPILMLSRWKSLLSFPKAVTAMGDYVAKNVEQHRESFDPENLRDITDGLLKASNEQTESDQKNFRLTENDLVMGTLSQFTGAGTEFPRMILQWALLYMIIYPDIQAEVQKELDEVVGDQQPGLNHRGKLPFTEACINEILRHASPTNLPAVTYGTISDTTLEDYFIPQKTPVLVNYYSLTRDECYWQEPEQFNPYRFLNENGTLRKNLLDKFYPFGIGPRRCLGEYLGRLQIFLFFTNLMHRCKFEQVPGEKLNLEPQAGFFAGPQDYKVIVKPRF